MPDALLHLNGDEVVWANPAAHALLAPDGEPLAGHDVFEFIDKDDLARVRSRYSARQRGESPPLHYEITAVRIDGSPVQVEILPRVVRPGPPAETLVVVRELREQAADRALLSALGELAARVQRVTTARGVVDAAVRGLHRLGFHVAAFRVDGAQGQVAAVALSDVARALVEETVAGALDDLSVPLAAMQNAQLVLSEERPLYIDDAASSFRNLLAMHGQSAPAEFDDKLREARLTKLVITPIILTTGPWGFLTVAGDRLRSNDAAAIALFTSQLASAMEVAANIERLQQQNEKLEAIHRVAMLGAEEPLGVLVPRMLRIVSEATGTDAACMYLLDAESGDLVLAGTHNYAGPITEQYARIPLASRTATGSTAASLHARSLSIEQWPEASRGDMAQAGFNETAIVPLVVNGRLGGTVNISRHARLRYTDDELRQAEMLVAQVALQVERARLYEDAQRRLDDLALMNQLGALINQHLDLEHVLNTAMEYVSRIVQVPNTFLMLLTPDGKALQMVASNDKDPLTLKLSLPVDGPTAAATSVRDGRPVLLEELPPSVAQDPSLARFGHRSLLALPLLSEGKPLGAMVMGETRGRRRFTPAEIDRGVAIANQLAVAIENARLYDEQRRRVDQLKLLLDISRVITGSLELEQILDASARSLVRMIDATDAFIFFLEENQLRGVVASSPELKDHFRSVRIPLSEPSGVGSAILTRSPVWFEDAQSSPEVNQTLNARYRQKSLLAIPLMLRDVPIGAISVGDRRRTRPFTDDEVERVLLISRQVAVAIDNARLFEDLKRSYHELSRAHKELVRRERLAALGELSAVVAHEVRNPLGVIFNSLSSLKRMMPGSEDARMLLGIVGEEADRLNRMVSDLLDFARPNEPQLRPEPLEQVVQGALEAAARAMPAPHVNVTAEHAPDVPPVPCDAQMLRQAVVNLVVNAVQAMPRGGTVKVTTKLEKRLDGAFARLEVQDDGPGIPAEVADRVFQPFFTTRAAGTGLGLAVVKRIADAHRADLSVKSRPGEGSTFTLLLPLTSPM